jgi:Circularly permutated YpsA SLOG family/Domain of unknown function (DUF6794)
MLKKIISSGQTGADRAALDVAIRLGIPHGDWIPKGRLAEDGPIHERCQLQEMTTEGNPARTEQNVIESDGTLIIARCQLTGGSDYTRKMTLKHRKQLLGIDLNLTDHYDAASLIASWIRMQKVDTLNVAGPRASNDTEIYRDVVTILEKTIQILRGEERRANAKPTQFKFIRPPKTVKDAVGRLISELSLKDKTMIANMAKVELNTLHTTLGEYIRNEFGLWSGNKGLSISCCFIAKREKVSEDDASSIIIRELWKRLKESYKLRIVK